jgi:intracellular multiplication protein IcmP
MNTNTPSRDSAFLVYLGGFAICCWLFWHFFHSHITNLFRILYHAELWLLSRVVSDPLVPQVRDVLNDTTHYAIDWPYVHSCSLLIGHYMRYPVALILLCIAYYLVVGMPKTAFKKAYSLDRLIAVQAKIWPVIAPIVSFNPATDNSRDPNGDVPDKLPVFAEALSPIEWLKFNHIRHGSEGLDHDAAARAFAEQLGPRWRGPNALPFHAKALYAVFALKSARMRDEADKLLGELSLCADPKMGMALRPSKALRREVDRIIADPKLGGEAIKVTRNHAYVTTALMHLLKYSRDRGGVLAPAQFLWLRGANRALWYPLNNVGRQSFHVEAAGAIAHFGAEEAAGAALISPKVEAAVASLSVFDVHTGQTLPSVVN